MLESIIAKCLFYLGNVYGMDWEDLKHTLNFTDYEVERCKELVEEYNNDR